MLDTIILKMHYSFEQSLFNIVALFGFYTFIKY
jgi:hypothetical protein